MTSAAYLRALGQIEARLRRNLVSTMAVQSLAGMRASRAKLGKVLDQQERALRRIKPPSRMAKIHADALTTLSTEFSDLLTLTTVDSCIVPESLTGFLYRVKLDIFEAVTSDSNGGRTWFGRKVLPHPPKAPAPERLNRRAENGSVFQRAGRRGSGYLEVRNNTSSDVVAVVSTGAARSPQASMYVRANRRATLRGIRGSFWLYLKTGQDWDGQRRGFTRDCSFERFDLRFQSGFGWWIDLARRPGGNAQSTEVPAF